MDMVQPPTSSASADPGAPEASYGLEELLAIAGEQLGEEITPRTVRLYATEGLIDRPDKDGRRAVYGQRHLLQLLDDGAAEVSSLEATNKVVSCHYSIKSTPRQQQCASTLTLCLQAL